MRANVQGLARNTGYNVQVRGINSIGESTQWSKTYKLTTVNAGSSGSTELGPVSWTYNQAGVALAELSFYAMSPPWIVRVDRYQISDIYTDIGYLPGNDDNVEISGSVYYLSKYTTSFSTTWLFDTAYDDPSLFTFRAVIEDGNGNTTGSYWWPSIGS